ncbi:hypothetical protein ACJX0J_022042, partial [Zea mays]
MIFHLKQLLLLLSMSFVLFFVLVSVLMFSSCFCALPSGVFIHMIVIQSVYGLFIFITEEVQIVIESEIKHQENQAVGSTPHQGFPSQEHMIFARRQIEIDKSVCLLCCACFLSPLVFEKNGKLKSVIKGKNREIEGSSTGYKKRDKNRDKEKNRDIGKKEMIMMSTMTFTSIIFILH